LHRADHRHELAGEAVHGERLDHVGVDAGLQRAAHGRRIRLGRQHHERRLRIARVVAHPVQQVQAAHHRHAPVADDDVDGLLAHEVLRGLAVLGLEHVGKAEFIQDLAHGGADQEIVVDDQDGSGLVHIFLIMNAASVAMNAARTNHQAACMHECACLY
jgi:hypothetical protein